MIPKGSTVTDACYERYEAAAKQMGAYHWLCKRSMNNWHNQIGVVMNKVYHPDYRERLIYLVRMPNGHEFVIDHKGFTPCAVPSMPSLKDLL